MPEALRPGDPVRLSDEGISVRITEMSGWRGAVLRRVDKDRVSVAWDQRDAQGNGHVWTERVEFLAKA